MKNKNFRKEGSHETRETLFMNLAFRPKTTICVLKIWPLRIQEISIFLLGTR